MLKDPKAERSLPAFKKPIEVEKNHSKVSRQDKEKCSPEVKTKPKSIQLQRSGCNRWKKRREETKSSRKFGHGLIYSFILIF